MSHARAIRKYSPQPRARRNDEAVLDALEAMLSEGLPGDTFSVDVLAKRAGCAKGTFYNHYDGKKAILFQLFSERFSERIVREVTQALDRESCQGKDIRFVISRYLRVILKLCYDYRGYVMALNWVHAFDTLPRDVQASLNDMSGRVSDCLKVRLLERSAQIGHPDPQTAIRWAEKTAFAALRDHAFIEPMLEKDADTTDDDALIEALTEMFTAYLRVQVSKKVSTD